MAYAFLDYMKIIDLEWPWRSPTTSTVGYSSDSWASCNKNSPGAVKMQSKYFGKIKRILNVTFPLLFCTAEGCRLLYKYPFCDRPNRGHYDSCQSIFPFASLSVCLSVCPVWALNSQTKRRRKTTIDVNVVQSRSKRRQFSVQKIKGQG